MNTITNITLISNTATELTTAATPTFWGSQHRKVKNIGPQVQ